MELLEWTFRFFFSCACFISDLSYWWIIASCSVWAVGGSKEQNTPNNLESRRFQSTLLVTLSAACWLFKKCYSVCCDQILCSTNLLTAGRVNGDVTSLSLWVSPAALHWKAHEHNFLLLVAVNILNRHAQNLKIIIYLGIFQLKIPAVTLKVLQYRPF